MNQQKPLSRKKLTSSNKNKFDVELPKINKTAFLFDHRSTEQPTFASKIAWVVNTCDYTQVSTSDVEKQYKKLRKELYQINQDVVKAIEKINMKPLRKSKNINQPVEKVQEIRQKEVENNCAILDRLKKELQSLQKRTLIVGATNKDDIDGEIQNVKEKGTKLKQKIKEIKLKSKAIGDSIENTDQIYQQIRQLENERQNYDRKKSKLVSKNDEVRNAIDKSNSKLTEIIENYETAELYLGDFHQHHKIQDQEKKVHNQYRQKLYQLEIHKKNVQSLKNSKTQKYHQNLKSLESQIEKIEKISNKTNEMEHKALENKSLILDLQDLLADLISQLNEIQKNSNNETMFFTEVEGRQKMLSELEKKDISLKINADKNKKSRVVSRGVKEEHHEKHYSRNFMRSSINKSSENKQITENSIEERKFKAIPKNNLISERVKSQRKSLLEENQQKVQIQINIDQTHANQKNHSNHKHQQSFHQNLDKKPQINQKQEPKGEKHQLKHSIFQKESFQKKQIEILNNQEAQQQKQTIKDHENGQNKILINTNTNNEDLNKQKVSKYSNLHQQIKESEKNSKEQGQNQESSQIDEKFKYKEVSSSKVYEKQTEFEEEAKNLTAQQFHDKNKQSEEEKKLEARKKIIDKYVEQQYDDEESMKEFKESIQENKNKMQEQFKINIDLSKVESNLKKTDQIRKSKSKMQMARQVIGEESDLVDD